MYVLLVVVTKKINRSLKVMFYKDLNHFFNELWLIISSWAPAEGARGLLLPWPAKAGQK
jgi:hypothetical protein